MLSPTTLDAALAAAAATTTLMWMYSERNEMQIAPSAAVAAVISSFAFAGAALGRFVQSRRASASSSFGLLGQHHDIILPTHQHHNVQCDPYSPASHSFPVAKFASSSSAAAALNLSASAGRRATLAAGRRGGVASLQAKKGKPNVPIQNRGAYVAQQKMQEQLSAMQPSDNGFPRFDLFCKSSKSPMWYPCGSFGGDERAKALVESWMNNPLNMGGMAKGQIDRSVAASLWNNPAQMQGLKQQVTKMYPALKNAKDDLKFGYKITFEGLEEAQGVQKVTEVTEDMKESAVDKLKTQFGFGGGDKN